MRNRGNRLTLVRSGLGPRSNDGRASFPAPLALSVNLIVAVIAGAAAITLLVVAWQQGW
jgi:hypothetical protein